jgi:hypothetical protein
MENNQNIIDNSLEILNLELDLEDYVESIPSKPSLEEIYEAYFNPDD